MSLNQAAETTKRAPKSMKLKTSKQQRKAMNPKAVIL